VQQNLAVAIVAWFVVKQIIKIDMINGSKVMNAEVL